MRTKDLCVLIHIKIKDEVSTVKTANIYVQRKVRIGTIPELYLRIVRIPTLSADSGIVPDILELRKGYFIDFCYNQALREVGMGWTK